MICSAGGNNHTVTAPKPAVGGNSEPVAKGGTSTRNGDVTGGGTGTRFGSEPRPDGGTATVAEPDTRLVTDDGDHDRFAHYTSRKAAARAYVEGTPLRALCGKVWVPSRDPSRYPVCPECEKIRQHLLQRNNN